MLQKEVIKVRLTSSLAHEDDFNFFKNLTNPEKGKYHKKEKKDWS